MVYNQLDEVTLTRNDLEFLHMPEPVTQNSFEKLSNLVGNVIAEELTSHN